MSWTDRLAPTPVLAQGEQNIAPAGTSLYSVEHMDAVARGDSGYGTPLLSRIERERQRRHEAHVARYETACFVCRSNLYSRRSS